MLVHANRLHRGLARTGTAGQEEPRLHLPRLREAALTSANVADLAARWGPRYRWYLLLSVMVGTMASIMSSTIVNVAIPEMSHAFSLGQERAQWVSSGFMVAMTVAMLTTPWMLGRFGYRRLYAATTLLLMAGGITGGFAS